VARDCKRHPRLTVHDITHLDALWKRLVWLLGTKLEINPAEAYVLGASSCSNDAGMCLAAYPMGLQIPLDDGNGGITVTSLLQQGDGGDISEAAVCQSAGSVFKVAVPQVLRVLHAQRAKDLPSYLENADGRSEPLIEDANLRTFYGPVIGNIAYSHHVSVGQLEGASFGNRLGHTPVFQIPTEWTVGTP